MNRFALVLSLFLLLAYTPLAYGDEEVLFYVHNKTSTPVYATLWEGKGIYVNDQEIQPGAEPKVFTHKQVVPPFGRDTKDFHLLITLQKGQTMPDSHNACFGHVDVITEVAAFGSEKHDLTAKVESVKNCFKTVHHTCSVITEYYDDFDVSHVVTIIEPGESKLECPN
ncbi:MAG: hypothetical protein NPIRA06_16820 [Nitrospirales bacterium]|nr:MAG: hypothetical protein NPIRA06_16820 [Nitrospirales bacterium]